PDKLSGSRDTIELRRARELRPIVDQIDYLLDIHSMQRLSAPLTLAGMTQKGRKLGRAIGVPPSSIPWRSARIARPCRPSSPSSSTRAPASPSTAATRRRRPPAPIS
ncbi:MAG TPA: hypothetical protein PKA74_08370, partial [Bauldia sp.]|nr:hypothetical protein [Bauldia sp.]